MNILVTNDDGIRAAGLAAVSRALLELGHRVVAVAPEENWSGTSHSISVHGPLRLRPVADGPSPTAYAVDGTPADAVRVASVVLAEPPDVVVSGVNEGPNLGPDVYRTGTVGAAREAVLTGWPALALSAVDGIDPSVLRRHLPVLLALAHRHPEMVVNVNMPRFPARDLVLVPVAWDAYREHPLADAADREGVRRVTFRRDVNPEPALSDVGAVLAGQVAVSLLAVRLPDTTAERLVTETVLP